MEKCNGTVLPEAGSITVPMSSNLTS